MVEMKSVPFYLIPELQNAVWDAWGSPGENRSVIQRIVRTGSLQMPRVVWLIESVICWET